MKRLVTIYLLFAASCICALADNYIGLWAGGGVALLGDDLEQTTAKAGVGGRVGLGWQYQKRMFTIEIGVEGTYQKHNIAVGQQTYSFPATDSQGKQFTYNAIISERTDNSRTLDLQVPVLLGIEVKHFYLLAGGKFNANLLGTTATSALLSTSGDYNRYYETLKNMPNHGFFENQAAASKGNISFNFDARLHFELGAVLRQKHNYDNRSNKYRIGLFAEIGLLNLNRGNFNQTATAITKTNPASVEINHIYTSTESNHAKLRGSTIGLRLSVLLPVGKQQSAYNSKCNCYQELFYFH